MANPDHLNTLRQGVDAWNAWREENAPIIPEFKIIPDLMGADLRGANLVAANLREANLSV
jgi:hypothetical protein